MYYLQVWKCPFFKKMAMQQYIQVKNVSSLRGKIVDRKGRILAFSSYADSCYVDPGEIADPAEVAERIAPYLLEGDVMSIFKKLTVPGRRFVWLQRRMNVRDSEQIKQMKIKGIGFVQEEKRLYPYGNIAGHLLGRVGSDNQPLSGIEYAADDILSGKAFTRKMRRDARGKAINIGYSVETKGNCDVRLTIDRTIQYIAESELEKAMVSTRAHKGVVIVQEPFSGEILAMAVFPQLNLHESGSVRDLFNSAISGVWEPGSTLKVVIAAAALEEGTVTLDEVLYCEQGEFTVEDRVIHDHEKHGQLTVRQIIENSSNIGMAKIGAKLGRTKLYYYIRAFGFGSYSGISLAGEAKGIFRAPRYWSGVSTSMLSFGQEIGVTPLQMIGAYSAIANGGYLMQPCIVKDVVDQQGQVVWSSKTEPIRRVLREETVMQMKEVLRGTITRGTGRSAQVRGFTVCGKTGTGQQIDKETKKYSDDRYLASFCGFLPSRIPRVCLLVFLDGPQGVYYGGIVAAPVFARIGARVMAYLNVPPDKETYPSESVVNQYVQASKIN